MGGWRTETSHDLSDAGSKIESVLASPPARLTEDQVRVVWLAYVEVEKSIAFVRFDIDEENPGRFIRLKGYAVPDERQALQFALKYLKRGSESFSLGDFRETLRWLRESRNYLRALLRERRLERVRRARRR